MYMICPQCKDRIRTITTKLTIIAEAVAVFTDSLDGTVLRIISADPQEQFATALQDEQLKCPSCGNVSDKKYWKQVLRCYNCNSETEQIPTTWCQDVRGRVCNDCTKYLESTCLGCGYYDNCALAQNRR